MKVFLVTGLFLLLAGCANPQVVSPLAVDLGHFNASTKLGCRFEKKFADTKASGKPGAAWYFWRDANKIETRDEASNQGEIWEKDHKGQLSYTRLFFDEGIALDFTSGDLAALNLTPSWDELNFIVRKDELGKGLKLTGRDKIDNTDVEHYQGAFQGIQTELDWLPRLQLPAQIIKKQKSGDFTLAMAQCGEANSHDLMPSNPSLAKTLRHIDFTDLGDMEDDPAVRKLEKIIGAHHD